MKEIEIWKSLDFLGYSNYEVSNFGKVKSLNYNHTRKERILKPDKSKKGYFKVCLWQNGKHKKYLIHRLVAFAFIPNPYNLPQINHKDENKENNHVNNLEFCSALYNNCYGTKPERISKSLKGKNKGKISPNKKPILQYTKDNVFIREWDSATTASKELKIHQQHISSCCNGKRKSTGGFLWQYKNNEIN